MKKITLEIEDDKECLFFGLLCNEKVFRLAWLVNRQLSLNLHRSDSIEWFDQQAKESNYFIKMFYEDELNHIQYTLLENFDEGKILFKELRTMNYFILVEGGLTFFDEKRFLSEINNIKEVTHISKINQARLKQKLNLVL